MTNGLVYNEGRRNCRVIPGPLPYRSDYADARFLLKVVSAFLVYGESRNLMKATKSGFCVDIKN